MFAKVYHNLEVDKILNFITKVKIIALDENFVKNFEIHFHLEQLAKFNLFKKYLPKLYFIQSYVDFVTNSWSFYIFLHNGQPIYNQNIDLCNVNICVLKFWSVLREAQQNYYKYLL